MCSNNPSIPRQKPVEPAKTADEQSTEASDEQRRRMLLARGLESTWTRSQYGGPAAGGAAGVAGGGKATNLGGTQ